MRNKFNLIIACLMIMVMVGGVLGSVGPIFEVTTISDKCSDHPGLCPDGDTDRFLNDDDIKKAYEESRQVKGTKEQGNELAKKLKFKDPKLSEGDTIQADGSIINKNDVRITPDFNQPISPGTTSTEAAVAGQDTRASSSVPGSSLGGQGGQGQMAPSPGSLTPQVDALLSAFASVWGTISGILGEMGAAVKPEGDVGVQPSDSGGAGYVDAFADNGGALGFGAEEDGEMSEIDKALAQTDPNGDRADLTVNKALTDGLMRKNVMLASPEELAISTLAETLDTYFVDEGGEGDPYAPGNAVNFNTLEGGGSDSLVTNAVISPITGEIVAGANPNQYVKWINHDLSIGGRLIVVDLLKSFNIVKVTGSNLLIRNGNTKVEFEGKNTLYPRVIKKTPHNMFRISNELDLNNVFKLRNYNPGEENYLIDGRRVVTVGNRAVPHPNFKGVMIAEVREDMWDDE